MATDAILSLNSLHCIRESDGTGNSEPYIWPVLMWIDDNTLVTPALVGVTAPAIGSARVVIKSDMRANQTADIPGSAGVLRVRLEDNLNVRRLILTVALWEEDETPEAAMRAGFQAFSSELRAAVADNLFALNEADGAELDAIIATIKKRVSDRVKSAIEDGLTAGEKIRVFIGTLNLDDIIDSAFRNFSDLVTTPFTLNFGINPSGRLLLYRDASQTGGGDVSNPSVIGQGGWKDFMFLFSDGNGIIYAVDQDGRLLLYRDASQTGGGDVSNPTVIGQGGWKAFKFLFSGGPGIIYAVDQPGRLLRYHDASQVGGGDVSNPTVIGQGGWQAFKFLFSGGNGIIYAVEQRGRLLRYHDASQSGGGDVSKPSVIGQGGWQAFKFLYSGGNGIIYAVEQRGRLLRYHDASQSGGGDVSSPLVIGQGGWQAFKFLFSGGNGIIYAVDQAARSANEYQIQGELQAQPVRTEMCQPEIDRLKAAQAAVDAIDSEIRTLQSDLNSASPAERRFILSEIRRIRREDLPAAIAALEEARQGLQACRDRTG